TSFKETRQKIVRLQHFTQYEIDEIQEKIDLNQGKEIRHDDDFDDFECLLFTEPQEHKDCKEEIERARQSYDTTSIVVQNDDVSTTYFDNKIETIKDINSLVDTAYEDNKRRAFKMQFLFGTISEELQQGKYVYDHQPLLDSHIQQYAPAMIINQQTIDQYKLYIKSCIVEMQDFQVTESTKYRYIGIYAMMVKVSRFPFAGLCYGQKIKVSPNQIRCEAKKQICKFYHLTKKQYDTFIIDYKGFDVVEEMNKLIINDKINVNIFYYDNDDKFYYL
ncbi:MAG: hypothetical protein EZS28_051544, partial [Streblomastix strix]